MSPKNVIAIDLGAESGRVIQVGFDGEQLTLEDIHRFPNIPVQTRGTLHWDVLRLWHEITTGIHLAAANASSIGVDTWGVDFALLDRDGNLLGSPVHYRDKRTEGMMEWVFERVPRRTVFERTGIQFIILNTLYQIASLAHAKSHQLEVASTFLTVPDLINYWLTGARVCEFSNATTTQFYNPRTANWDFETLSALGVPTPIFPEIIQPGTRLGAYNGIPVIAPACHDTGSAVVGVPATTPNFAYLSSGTWSLLGLEIDKPVINDAIYAANLTNEGGAYHTTRFLKNVAGLWLAQQSRVAWREQGSEYSYEQLAAEAAKAEPFRSLIDPDEPAFLPPGDMPARIREFCRRTDQPIPETVGQVMRAIYESLALKYRLVLENLITLSGRTVDHLHIIGGGTQNKLLCQMTADAIGRVVLAGPIEATAIGNAIVQFISLGELANIGQAREILSRTVNLARYEPQQTADWTENYERFKSLVSAS